MITIHTRVLDYFQGGGQSCTPAELADTLNVGYLSVQNACFALWTVGYLTRVASGKSYIYSLKS